ncbi:MAG: hypothetical protein IJX40_00220 [Alistipes sp.]|nr:hypothetical protein [Alistipes sp.]
MALIFSLSACEKDTKSLEIEGATITSSRELTGYDSSIVTRTLTAETVRVKGNIAEFDCDDVKMTTIDVTHCATLRSLNVCDNLFTTLDVSSCKALEWLGCCHRLGEELKPDRGLEH